VQVTLPKVPPTRLVALFWLLFTTEIETKAGRIDLGSGAVHAANGVGKSFHLVVRTYTLTRARVASHRIAAESIGVAARLDHDRSALRRRDRQRLAHAQTLGASLTQSRE
jgi:hypothetical protein